MEAMEIDDNNVMEVVEMDNNDEMENQPLNHEQNLELVRNKVFGNHLIVFKILRNLDHLDILECRKVSRWWCQIATQILGNNGSLQFEYCDFLGCFIRTLRQVNDYESAESMQDYLLPSFWTPSIKYADRHAPVFVLGTTFIEDLHSLHAFTKLGRECQGGGFLFNRIKLGLWGYSWLTGFEDIRGNRRRDIEEFLCAHGSKVVELGVDLGCYNGISLKFLSLLLRHMPNLEKLHIGIPVNLLAFDGILSSLTFPVTSKTLFKEEMSHINLPKLKLLAWTRGYRNQTPIQSQPQKDPWFGDLLDVIEKSAPNLQSTVRIPCRSPLLGSQFIPIVKVPSCHQMIFNPIPENIGQYMKFANGRPQLCTIVFDLEKTQEKISQEGVGSRFESLVKLSLRRILESSQLTLKKVKGRSQVESLECLRELAPLLPPNSRLGNVMTSAHENCSIPNSIIMKILDNLPASLLLNTTRLVSRQWREISNQILIQRKSLQINFGYSPRHQRYILNSTQAINSEFTEDLPTLYKFTGCAWRVSRSTGFPCIRFGFSNSLICSQDWDDFCEMYGSKVQELELTLDTLHMDTSLSQILKLTQVEAHKTCSLKVLTLVGDVDRNSPHPSRTVVSPIAGLRSLELNPYGVNPFWKNQLRDLIRTRGLKLEFREIDPTTFTVDQWTPKISSTHLELKVPSINGKKMEMFLEKLEQIADSCPRLWSLNVDLRMCFWPTEPVKNRMARAVQKILVENQRNLTQLQGIQQLQLMDESARHFLSDLSFPYVVALTLSHGRGDLIALSDNPSKKPRLSTLWSLPRGVELSSCFPNLKEVMLDYGDHKRFFTPQGIFLRYSTGL